MSHWCRIDILCIFLFCQKSSLIMWSLLYKYILIFPFKCVEWTQSYSWFLNMAKGKSFFPYSEETSVLQMPLVKVVMVFCLYMYRLHCLMVEYFNIDPLLPLCYLNLQYFFFNLSFHPEMCQCPGIILEQNKSITWGLSVSVMLI